MQTNANNKILDKEGGLNLRELFAVVLFHGILSGPDDIDYKTPDGAAKQAVHQADRLINALQEIPPGS